MPEIKIQEPNNKIIQIPIRGRWKIRFIGPVPSSGDRDTTERALTFLGRTEINPDLAMSGLAVGQGLRILEGSHEDWLLEERDPSQPVSVIQNHGDTIVHTRELIERPKGSEKMREFIVNIVSKHDVSGVKGLSEIMQKTPTENNLSQFPAMAQPQGEEKRAV